MLAHHSAAPTFSSQKYFFHFLINFNHFHSAIFLSAIKLLSLKLFLQVLQIKSPAGMGGVIEIEEI